MKNLEARKADRAKREEAAKEDHNQARDILAQGTLAEGKFANDANGDTVAIDYFHYPVAELKEDLDARGIEYDSGAKKADLISLLEADDEG